MANIKKIQYPIVFIIDVLCICGAVTLSYLTSSLMSESFTVSAYDMRRFILQLTFTFFAIFFFFPPVKNVIARSYSRTFLNSIILNLVGLFILLAVMFVCDSNLLNERTFVLFIMVYNILLSFIFHSLLKMLLTRKIKSKTLATLTAVITTRENAEEVISAFKYDWTRKIVGISLYDEDEPARGEISGVRILTGKNGFIDRVRKDSIDEVFIDIPTDDKEYIENLIDELKLMGVTVNITIPFINKLDGNKKAYKYCEVNGYPSLTYVMKVHNALGLIVKRVFDIMISIVGIVVSIPIVAIVAIPLLIESPGPLLFKQKRVGKNGRVFYMYKLRSMCKDAERQKRELMEQNEMDGYMFKMKDDPRITKVGKFIRATSIDELPQFINILKGDMSLIGTRPPTYNEYRQYMSHHKRRLSMKPGLTGLWQVSGRSNITDFEEVVKLDLKYIDNWSIFLDIKIIFKTIKVVLSRKGSE
ncbi:MAG: sugar transferase [Eubacteriales bacterium]|nr:sugar transferase [Eubacteriales bacterium]